MASRRMAANSALVAVLRDAPFGRSSESDSKFYSAAHGLARRLESRLTAAIRNQASALAMVRSKSLASLRLRPSQAKVRSTTQRWGSGLKLPVRSVRVTISIFQRPNAAIALRSFLPR